jgi:hypothetical protein
MAELREIISVEGAVDREVVEEPSLLPVVADLLVPYRDGEVVGWFEALSSYVKERTGDDPPFPSLEDALASLADKVPMGRECALRLFALTVASRVVRECSPDGSLADAVQAALVPLTPNVSITEAAMLHNHIFDVDHDFPTIEAWGDMVTRAGEMGVLDHTTAMQTIAPCTQTWRPVVVGGTTVSAGMLTTTEFFPGFTIENIEPFLEPANWPDCHPFWCAMDPVNPPVPKHRLYTEVVSLDCYAPGLSFTTVLEFATVRTPATSTSGERVVVSYWLWPPPNAPQGDGEIIVDEGYISAWEGTGGLYLKSVKTVAFKPPFPSTSLAMIMCPLGYAAQGEHMIYSCAVPTMSGQMAAPSGGSLVVDDPADLPEPAGTHSVFVLQPPRSPLRRRGGARGVRRVGDTGSSGSGETATVAQPSTAASAPGLQGMARTMADGITQCGNELAASYAASYDKMVKGTYTSGDAMADGLTWWSRLVRDVGVVAAAARAGGRRPPSNPAPDPGPDPASHGGATS